MRHIIISGAYGRTYTSKEAVLRDWKMGKDFRIRSIGVRGTYMSIRDADDIKTVEVRYNKDVDLCVLEKRDGEWVTI